MPISREDLIKQLANDEQKYQEVVAKIDKELPSALDPDSYGVVVVYGLSRPLIERILIVYRQLGWTIEFRPAKYQQDQDSFKISSPE